MPGVGYARHRDGLTQWTPPWRNRAFGQEPTWPIGSTIREADMRGTENPLTGVERATRLLVGVLGETLHSVRYGVYDFELPLGLDSDTIELCGTVEMQFRNRPGLTCTWIPLESARAGKRIGDWELGIFEIDVGSKSTYADASNFRVWRALLGTRLVTVEIFGLLGAPIVARFQFESGAALIGVGSGTTFCCFDSVVVSADRPSAGDFDESAERIWTGAASPRR